MIRVAPTIWGDRDLTGDIVEADASPTNDR
jgi:hypothetical protein